MENDSKGKNVSQGSSTDVPTFVRAASNVQELVFSGELRLRNEYSVTDNQAANNTTQADVDRFRFRLFADYKLNNNFFAGAAVQTALASDSGNTTFSEGFDNYSLYLWRFFVGWHSKDDSLKFIVGKQPNPFYEETELLWDADISPTGITEQVKYEFSPQFSLGLVGGQFIFNDNPENAFYNGNGTDAPAAGTAVPGGDANNDAYLAYQQLVATFTANNNLSVDGSGRLPVLSRTRRPPARSSPPTLPQGMPGQAAARAMVRVRLATSCRIRQLLTRPTPRATFRSAPSTVT